MTKKTYFYRGMLWREVIDSIGHFLHLPKFIQRRLCDWVDENYYK